MITIESLIELYNTLTVEEWNELYNNLGADLTKDWNAQYSDVESEAVKAYNTMYTYVVEGRVSELPANIQQLIKDWNLIK